MRTAFQIIFFIAYIAALAWGGWYALSGQMVADREAATPMEQTDVTVEEELDTEEESPPSEQP